MREQVLALLQRHLKGKLQPSGGSNVLTKCPFHKHGEERKPSFSVNLDKGVFNCFTCHVTGNIKHLLRDLGVPSATIDAETAIIQPFLSRNIENLKLDRVNSFQKGDPFKAEYPLPEAILGVFDWLPIKLVNDGFNPELLHKMEIGYDRNLNRITYPLRDMYGNLAGFSGGATEATASPWPKYKVYQGGRTGVDPYGRQRWIPGDFGEWFDEQFPGYTCENHDFLWNYHKVLPRMLASNNSSAKLYVVEGFKACLWMIQAGFENTVALMGSYISERQQQMLHRLGCTVVLFLDNDDAGRRASFNVGNLLWRPMYGRVQVVRYPQDDDNTQPDDYETDAVQYLANEAIQPYTEFVNSIR